MRSIYAASRLLCLLLASFVLSAGSILAQGKEELRAKLGTSTKQDSSRVKILFELAGEYIQSDLDSMEFFAREGLVLAEQVKFERGIARCSQLMGLVCIRRHDFEKALRYYHAALDIFEKTGDKTMAAEVMVYMGDIYYRDSKYNKALEYYNKAVVLDEEVGDLKTEGLALIDIGGIYTDQGSFAEAVKYYLKGLQVFEKQGDNKGISMTLVNIANVYSAMGDYDRALQYVNKSLPITQGISDKEVVFSNMVNIGVIYSQTKQYEKALEAFRNGMLLADSLGDMSWRSACIVNIADVYFHMGEFEKSLNEYTVLLKQNEELKDTSFILPAHTGIGNNLVSLGKVNEGIKELQIAFAIARTKQMKQSLFDVAHSLSEAYERQHDYARALAYHKIYFQYRDSLNNEKNERKIAQMQFDYELQKKEELLNKNKILAQDRADRQRITIWTVLSGLVLVIVICVILFRSGRREKQHRKKITLQKAEIEQQAARLEELNKFKDKTFSVLSHDLRAPIGALTATMSMLDDKVITADDFMRLKPEVQSQLTSVNLLLDNLLNWARGYMQGDFSGKKDTIDLNALVESSIAVTADIASKKDLTIINSISQGTTAFGNEGQMDIVVRNLLMNAIKFSNKQGTITCSSTDENGVVRISITDEGVGMTQQQLDRLFTATSGNSTYGTGGEKGVGLGLLLCYEFVKANNGVISVASEAGKGSTFTFTLPANGKSFNQ